MREPRAVDDVEIRPFRDREAAGVAAWKYPPPFDLYDGNPAQADDYLAVDAEGFGFYALVHPDDEVVGFCCFGPEARVRGQHPTPGVVDLGGGVRPDLVSQRIASGLLPTVIEYAQTRFTPRKMRVAVAAFNERSLRLCRSAGFEVVRRFDGSGGEFHELVRPADSAD